MDAITLKMMIETGDEMFGSDELMEEAADNLLKIDTYRGLVRFLAKEIPCSCLNEEKKRHK